MYPVYIAVTVGDSCLCCCISCLLHAINSLRLLPSVKEKFQKREYKTITEFVTDVRRMIYNCCSFNGINHPISKKAMKIEYILSQKLNLLRQ